MRHITGVSGRPPQPQHKPARQPTAHPPCSSMTAVGGNSGYFALLLVNFIIVIIIIIVAADVVSVVVVVVAGSSTPPLSSSIIARTTGVTSNWKYNHLRSWSLSPPVASSVDNANTSSSSNNNNSILTRGSVLTDALRGGGAAAAAAARTSKSGIGNSSKHSRLLWRHDWNGRTNDNIHAEHMVRQKLSQLEKIQHNAMRQLRSTLRLKQTQFQNSIYVVNSKLDSSFPRPPYSIWRQFNNEQSNNNRQQQQQQQTQGKTTITGNIFLFNIAIFGLQSLYPQLTAWGAKRSDLILNGRQLHRLITPIFLHGGVAHLVANSYSLKSMGVNVERTFGQSRLLLTYLISGMSGNILSALQSPKPSVGASGAIFGLVGAYYTFLSRNQAHLRNAEYQKNALLETIGLNILLGLTNPMIDNWGHLGGFIGGVGMSYLIGPKLYIARVPSPLLLGDNYNNNDNEIASSSMLLSSLGISSGRIVIDRPMLVLCSPQYLNDSVTMLFDSVTTLGRNVKENFNNRNRVQEYSYDGIVDDITKIVDDSTGGGEDGTICRVLKDNNMSGANNINRHDILRTQQREGGRTRMKIPREGHSLRPKYSHMY